MSVPVRLRSARRPSILCGVDFSDTSGRALTCAFGLAGRSGVVTVLYAHDPLLAAAADAAAYDRATMIKQTDEELRRFVETWKPASRRRPHVQYAQGRGRPAQVILATARRLDCDVIVLGTQGRSALSYRLFGSTTDRVLKSTDIAIIAVPPVTRGRSHQTDRHILSGCVLGLPSTGKRPRHARRPAV